MLPAERIIHAAQLKGLNQAQLVAKTGISKSTMSKIFSGARVSSVGNADKLAQVLDVSPAWLMGFSVPMEPGVHGYSKGPGIVWIPIQAKVPARGKPLIAGEHDEAICISRALTADADIFALKVGEDGIEPWASDDAVMIVRRQDRVKSGQLAIVTIEGGPQVCRRVITQGNGMSLFMPDGIGKRNSYSEKLIKNLPIKIIGRVIEVRAKF